MDKIDPKERLQVTACRYWFNKFRKYSKSPYSPDGCKMAFANAIEVTSDTVMEDAMKSRKGKFDELMAMGTMNGIMLSPHRHEEMNV